jgi:hypothetical protein
MTIRNASLGDIDDIAVLAQESLYRLYGGEPARWESAAPPQSFHPLLLRRALRDGRSFTLVAERDQQFAGFVSASLTALPGRRRPLLIVDHVGATLNEGWDAVIRALLAAVAARLKSSDALGLAVGCPVGDRGLRRVLAEAGFAVKSSLHFRTLRTSNPYSKSQHTGRPDLAELQPLPARRQLVPSQRQPVRTGVLRCCNLHGLSTYLSDATLVHAPGARALLSHPFHAAPQLESGRPILVADAVLGASRGSLNSLMEHVERQAARQEEVGLFVAVSPSQPLLDHTLTARRYRHTSDWCLLPAR